MNQTNNSSVFYEKIDNFYFSKKPFFIVLVGLIIFAIIQITLFAFFNYQIGYVTSESSNSYVGWISIALSFTGSLLYFYGSFFVARGNKISTIYIFLASILLMINAIVITVYISCLTYLFTLAIIFWRNYIWLRLDKFKKATGYIISALIALVMFSFVLILVGLTIDLDFMQHYKENTILLVFDLANFFLVIFGTLLVNFKIKLAFLLFSITKIFSISISIYLGELIIVFQLFVWLVIDFTTFLLWNYRENKEVLVV